MLDVSGLQVDDKSVRLIVLGVATECHDLALARGIPSPSVEHQLPLVFRVLDSHLGNLLDIRDVPAVGTTDISGLSIRFSNEGYRALAEAAKDLVALPVDGDGYV